MLPARTAGESSVSLVERIQSILASKDLTLYRVSRRSAELYGRSSASFIPHNFYSDLRTSSFTASLQQIAALSRISGYRLADWLIVFGFELEHIALLQVLLPSKRTIRIDNSLVDLEDSIPWFSSRANAVENSRITPLVQLLERTLPRKLSALVQPDDGDFLFAKIGSEDAFAFPDLAPGSIVRVDLKRNEDGFLRDIKEGSDRVFLIEHSKGLCCCPLRLLSRGVILPVGRSLPYARIPFRVPVEARILGVVDLEIRLLRKTETPVIPRDLARIWKPQPLVSNSSLGRRLYHVRTGMNLSLREAATVTRRIAALYGNPHYGISASSLYDYEQSNGSPRDFRKVASLCSLYGIQFRVFLDALELSSHGEPSQAVPSHLLPRHAVPEIPTEKTNAQLALLDNLLEQFGSLPLFLRNSLEMLSNSAKLALDDCFWVGWEQSSFHPFLSTAVLAIVNRRRKTALHFPSKPFWQQPIYLLLRRGGDYLAACCGDESGALVIHPYTAEFCPPLIFRKFHDAEVVGQIVALARRLH